MDDGAAYLFARASHMSEHDYLPSHGDIVRARAQDVRAVVQACLNSLDGFGPFFFKSSD